MPVRAETRSRALALQLLYAREMMTTAHTDAGVLRLSPTTPRVQERALALADEVTRRMEELDGHIRRAAEHWRIERIAPIDRHILRLGAAELSDGQTPPRVVLDESVKLARWFGGEKSPAFVNGVLDRVARDLGRL